MVPYSVTFHPSWWHDNAGVSFTSSFFDAPETRLAADCRMRRCLYERFGAYGLGEPEPLPRPVLGTDLLAAGYLYSEILGCGIRYSADSSPQVLCAHLDESNIDGVALPDLDRDPVWARTQKQIDWLMARYGRVEPCINLQGVQNIAFDLMGENLFLAYCSGAEAVHRLLDRIADLSIGIAGRLYKLSGDISGGVTAIIRRVAPDCYLTSNCTVEMISNAMYEDFLLGPDTKLALAFPSFGVHHCGQSMEHVLKGYAKLPNVHFLEVGAGSDLGLIRERFPCAHVTARFSPARLLKGPTADIRKGVRELYLEGRGWEGRLSVSCVGIGRGTPDGHVTAFLEACAAAGAY